MRNKAAVSDIRDFTEQKFRPVLEEPTYTAGDRNKVRRVLLTSGKIYYELAAHKAKDKRDDVAIALIEQLAALPRRRLAETLDRYPHVEEKFWVQEESANGRLAQVRPGAARAVSRQVGRHQADSRSYRRWLPAPPAADTTGFRVLGGDRAGRRRDRGCCR